MPSSAPPSIRTPRFPAPALLLAAALLLARTAASDAQPTGEPSPLPDTEPYRLSADRLEGSATAAENVYTARRVTVQHGSTTVTGDSATIYRTKELVVFRGNVRIVDGATRMWGREASYDRKTRIATLRGDVLIEEGGARIRGREAQFYRNENRSVITGDPRLEDSTRTLTADRIEYDRNRDLVTATGNVDAYDRAENTRVRARRVRYDRRADYAWAEDEPVLELTERGGKATVVRGTILEFDNRRRRAYAIGNVRVERDKLRAFGERAEFYRNENRALLLGAPYVLDEEGTARGDSIEIFFAGNRLESLRLRPNAAVEYRAKDPTGRGERNHAKGDTIVVYFEEEEAREAVIVGHAESRYWPSGADSAQGGRNVSTGDTIRVAFEGGKPVRAVVRGNSRGLYHLAAEGDTSRAVEREQVRYQGDEIFYDVERGIVDVVGKADVTYQEVRLTADRVTFDSNNDRMRAEGNPVLNDGRERIVGETMTYDLNSRRGTILEGRTTYERGFLYGERVRRVSENELNVANGTYTTCDLREPHFHFGSDKMKVLLRDKVVARPVVFYIKRIPVLALPFYVFPIKTGRHSGFQLPHVEFGSSSAGGKFVRNVGYYWAISDFMDATAWFDYYQQKSWVAHGQYRYKKRYGYEGQIASSDENQFASGLARWDLRGSHYQTLGTNFALTARADMTNSSEYRQDLSLGRSVLLRVDDQLRSNLSLQRGWSGGTFSLGLIQNQYLDVAPGVLKNHRQLPRMTFSLNARPIGRAARGLELARLPWLSSTIYSFRATGIYERREYERSERPETTVVFDTLGVAIDTTVAQIPVDSTDARGATRVDFSLTDSRMLGGFLRVSPSVAYSGVYYSRDESGETHRLGGVWNAGVGINTAIYGTFRTSIGPLRAVRHVITPSARISYQPANAGLLFRDASGILRQRFAGVSEIGLPGGESKLLSFALRNDVHAKWGNPARPTILNNLIHLETQGTYNVLAKRTGAKPLSDLSTSLTFKPIERSAFHFGFVHNPYDRKLLSFNASTGIAFQGQSQYGEEETSLLQEPGAAAVREPTGLTPREGTPSGLPWMFSVSAGYTGSRSRVAGGGYNEWSSRASLNGATSLNLSKNWHLDYGWQFDVNSGKMISQRFTVKRELHCWEMTFTRSISGDVADEYYFKINVKNLPEVYFEQGSRGLRGFGGIQDLY